MARGDRAVERVDGKAMNMNGLKSASVLAENKPHGTRIKYLGGCRCVPCKAAASRYESERQARRRQGQGNGLIDTRDVVTHLKKLSDQGVGYKAACEAAGVGKSSVNKILTGKRTQMRAANARLLLAVTADMAIRDGALVPAKPTWRRIRWLMNEGMTQGEIARRLGYKTRKLQIGKGLIRASTAMKVEKLVSIMRLGE